MIYKGYYTLTIDEYCQLKDNPKAIMWVKYPWPEKWIQKAIKKLNQKIAVKFNKKEIDSQMYDRTMLIHMESKVNLYIVMYKALLMSWAIKPNKDILDLFEKHFKKPYKPEYLPEIVDKIEKFKTMIRQSIEKLKQPEQKELDLIELATKIEGIIGYPIGNQKLFKLNNYITQANKIVESRTKDKK